MVASVLKVRLICAVLFFSFASITYTQNSQQYAFRLTTNPHLLSNNTEKETIKKLIQSEDWALKAQSDMKQTIDPYVDRHQTYFMDHFQFADVLKNQCF